MEQFVIGRDIYFEWPIEVAGQPQDLENLDLQLILKTPLGEEINWEHSAKRNVLKFCLPAHAQKHVGTYGFVLWMNRGKQNACSVDKPKAFRLVSSSLEENINGRLPGEVVILSSDNLFAGITREGGGGLSDIVIDDSQNLLITKKKRYKLTPADESDIKVSGIDLTADTDTLYSGSTTRHETTITAAITPSDASNKQVRWSSSNTDIATVDNQGKVTAVGPGDVDITCTAQDGSGVSQTLNISVIAKIATGRTYVYANPTVNLRYNDISVAGGNVTPTLTYSQTKTTKTEYNDGSTTDENTSITSGGDIEFEKKSGDVTFDESTGQVTYNNSNKTAERASVAVVKATVTLNNKQGSAETTVYQEAAKISAHYGWFFVTERPTDDNIAATVLGNIPTAHDVELETVQLHDTSNHTGIYNSSSEKSVGQYAIHYFMLPKAPAYSSWKIQQCFQSTGIPVDENLSGSYGACNDVDGQYDDKEYRVYAMAIRANNVESVDFVANLKQS